MSIFIKVNILAGAHIREAFRDMQYLADQTNCNVEGKFNGVDVWTTPGGTFEAFYSRFDAALKREKHP